MAKSRVPLAGKRTIRLRKRKGKGPDKVAIQPLPADGREIRRQEALKKLTRSTVPQSGTTKTSHMQTTLEPGATTLRGLSCKIRNRILPGFLVFEGENLVHVTRSENLLVNEKNELFLFLKKRTHKIKATKQYMFVDRTSPERGPLDLFPFNPTHSPDIVFQFVDTDMPSFQALINQCPDVRLVSAMKELRDQLAAHSSNKATTGAATGLDVTSIVKTLPSRTILQLRQIWLNALRMNSRLKEPSRDLSTLLAAIETEWQQRGLDGKVVEADFFQWPTTEAATSKNHIEGFSAPGEGMLAYLEYHVGKTKGLITKERRAILDRVFSGKLPPVFDKAYMDQWGDPSTARRLQKMAESIAAFTRNFKRRDDDKLDQAIREWEADLAYLFEAYYIGKFRFAWPTTKTT